MARQLYAWQGRTVTGCRDEWGHVRPHEPGRDHCRACWPPRGRGRGEARYSARRVLAIERAIEATHLLALGKTYTQIARTLGYADKSVAWNAIHRLMASDRQKVRIY